MPKKSAQPEESKIRALDLLEVLSMRETSEAELQVLMAQLGSVLKRKGKWILVLPDMIGFKKIIDACRTLNKVRDADGVPHPERLPPLIRSKAAKIPKRALASLRRG